MLQQGFQRRENLCLSGQKNLCPEVVSFLEASNYHLYRSYFHLDYSNFITQTFQIQLKTKGIGFVSTSNIAAVANVRIQFCRETVKSYYLGFGPCQRQSSRCAPRH